MCRLRIAFLIFMLAGFTCLILHPATASSALPKASIAEVNPALHNVRYIVCGQKIAVYVEVHVKEYSPVPLEKFSIVITLEKPNGERITVKRVVDDKIYPGRIKGYTFKLDVVADQAGTWKYKVELWVCVKNKWYKLDEKAGTFVVRLIPKAEIIVVDIGNNKTVERWQKITFKIKVCVRKDSLVSLDGFRVFISLQKPDGKLVRAEITRNDKINPGECREYTVQLEHVANQVGTWKYDVGLYTKGGDCHLDSEEGTFEVREGESNTPKPPESSKTGIEVLDVFGYTVAASMICTGLALILSRIIIR